jgi:hypothetical protein
MGNLKNTYSFMITKNKFIGSTVVEVFTVSVVPEHPGSWDIDVKI